MTCSSELLRQSRKTITSLVTLHNANINNQAILQENAESTVQCLSLEFHKFIYSFLTEDEKKYIFPLPSTPLKANANRVDYSFFIRMWEKGFAKNPEFRRYTPELAWHVIRTYIKGMSMDNWIDAGDYRELDNREKSVSYNTFKDVYNVIWKKYSEECRKNKLWDDQDLARYLLKKNRIPSGYMAIFCDEAQDFTRIELEILLRLSVFSMRKLKTEEVNRVPFVFAGDPFQTLNPTGFRWEAVKATFFQKFIASLDPFRQTSRTGINYRELHYNYRSTPNIVKFTNNIQMLRRFLFRMPGIEPQIPWQYKDSSEPDPEEKKDESKYEDPGDPPCWFNWDNQYDLKDKIEENQDVVIIVPCRDGEEKDFVKNDPRLNEWIPKDDTGVPMNVLSAIRAKGLEFDRVALYGFGIHANDGLLSDIGNAKQELTQEWILPREYFINRLYVAASRAKKQLFIIDNKQGYERLWRFMEESNLDTILKFFSEEEQKMWLGKLGGMLVPGDDRSWEKDRGNRQDTAKRYEEDGKLRRDPYLMRSAAMIFESIGRAS